MKSDDYYYGDPRREHRELPDGQAYQQIFMRSAFAVDGILYHPPRARSLYLRTGGEGLMISVKIDRPGGEDWQWKPRQCPTAQALAMVKPGEYL